MGALLWLDPKIIFMGLKLQHVLLMNIIKPFGDTCQATFIKRPSFMKKTAFTQRPEKAEC